MMMDRGLARPALTRWVALAALGLTAAAPPPPAPPPSALQRFEFKGVWAGVPADLHPFKCRRPRPDGMVDCKPRNATIASIRRAPVVMTFHNRMLAALYIAVPWSDFDTLEAAFTEKYGPPTAVEHPPFQGVTGALTNTVATWRFATGRLTLTQDVYNEDSAEAVYAEDSAPAPPRPIIDF
jgi:hypothetical protein